MSISYLEHLAGPADAVREFQANDAVAAKLYSWNRSGLVAATRDGKRVEYLYLTPGVPGAEKFKTEKGIGKGATRTAVLKAYGKPTACNTVVAMPGASTPLRCA